MRREMVRQDRPIIVVLSEATKNKTSTQLHVQFIRHFYRPP